MDCVDPNALAVADGAAMSYTRNHIALSSLDEDGLLPPIELIDGSVWSIQASHNHASTRVPVVFPTWSHVEVLILKGEPPAGWERFEIGLKRYGNVPEALVDRQLLRRGIKAWKGPVAND